MDARRSGRRGRAVARADLPDLRVAAVPGHRLRVVFRHHRQRLGAADLPRQHLDVVPVAVRRCQPAAVDAGPHGDVGGGHLPGRSRQVQHLPVQSQRPVLEAEATGGGGALDIHRAQPRAGGVQPAARTASRASSVGSPSWRSSATAAASAASGVRCVDAHTEARVLMCSTSRMWFIDTPLPGEKCGGPAPGEGVGPLWGHEPGEARDRGRRFRHRAGRCVAGTGLRWPRKAMDLRNPGGRVGGLRTHGGYTELAEWAENEMVLNPDSPAALRGAAATESGRVLLASVRGRGRSAELTANSGSVGLAGRDEPDHLVGEHPRRTVVVHRHRRAADHAFFTSRKAGGVIPSFPKPRLPT